MYQTQETVWVSNSSIGDFLKCPRAYFLKNVYKNENKRKVTLINPALALGQAVHEVLESLICDREERFKTSLINLYEQIWEKNYTGELGGFISQEQENEYKIRGQAMIQRVIDHPGILLNLALRPTVPNSFIPQYQLSAEHNITLCGKIDWLEYIPETDSVHIVDFKTGKNDEDEDALQLSIYALLVEHIKKRTVSKISYWYLNREDEPREIPMPDLKKAEVRILYIALRIKETRLNKSYTCPENGCYACIPLEAILQGRCKYVKTNDYQDIFIAQTKN